MKSINILLADAHALTRAGIKALLSEHADFKIISEVTTSEDLHAQLRSCRPDLIIIDYHILGHFSVRDIEWLRKNYPDVFLLIISSNNNKKDVSFVLELGISGYLLKECDKEEIISAVRAVANGEKFFCGRVMDSILNKSKHECIPGEFCNHCMPVTLSNREVEIVKLIADGLTTKDIARKIHLSFFTVATHRKNIFKKLQIRNSPELILYALKEGIIS